MKPEVLSVELVYQACYVLDCLQRARVCVEVYRLSTPPATPTSTQRPPPLPFP